MKKLEKIFFEAIYKSLKFRSTLINDYFNWRENEFIESWKRYWIDKNFQNLFWSCSLNQNEKDAILKLIEFSIETEIFWILRLLEWDLYYLEWYKLYWYTLPVDKEKYIEKDHDWHWWIIKVVDLEWNYITDNSLYENFIEYLWNIKDNEDEIKN